MNPLDKVTFVHYLFMLISQLYLMVASRNDRVFLIIMSAVWLFLSIMSQAFIN